MVLVGFMLVDLSGLGGVCFRLHRASLLLSKNSKFPQIFPMKLVVCRSSVAKDFVGAGGRSLWTHSS